MYCELCERLFINEKYHNKEQCDKEQIPLTNEEFLETAERLFDFEIQQCNYGKRINDGLRRMHTIIREAVCKE
jgi:hypothetical protein